MYIIVAAVIAAGWKISKNKKRIKSSIISWQ